MKEYITLSEMDQAADYIRAHTTYRPTVALVLGSGLGELANSVEDAETIAYNDIPMWPVSTVLGHKGQLVIGKLEGQIVMVMQGRVHYYEGYSMAETTFPIRVMQRLGIQTIVLTNAAGSINPDFNAGDVMLITDHIALIGMAGLNPLRGANIAELGERFPDMSQVYDRKLGQVVRNVAVVNKLELREGVYVCLAGPSFETPADLRFLRAIGADAVGMSTVPEAIVARHGRTRLVGISGISNKANLDGNTETTHEEVLEAGRVLVPKMTTLIRGLLRQMD